MKRKLESSSAAAAAPAAAPARPPAARGPVAVVVDGGASTADKEGKSVRKRVRTRVRKSEPTVNIPAPPADRVLVVQFGSNNLYFNLANKPNPIVVPNAIAIRSGWE